MAKKKFIFNDFYYSTKRVDFNKIKTVNKSDISAIANIDTKNNNAFCEIKYDFAGYMPMMVKIDSRFYVKQSDTDIYSVYEGKSVFKLDNEYPAYSVGDFHSNNGTVWNLGVILAELAFQHLSKHVGYIYCETKDKILIEIPATYGVYINLFKENSAKNKWILLEEHFLDRVELVQQMTDEECEQEFDS